MSQGSSRHFKPSTEKIGQETKYPYAFEKNLSEKKFKSRFGGFPYDVIMGREKFFAIFVEGTFLVTLVPSSAKSNKK